MILNKFGSLITGDYFWFGGVEINDYPGYYRNVKVVEIIVFNKLPGYADSEHKGIVPPGTCRLILSSFRDVNIVKRDIDGLVDNYFPAFQDTGSLYAWEYE